MKPDTLHWLQEAIESYQAPLTRFAERILRDADRARDVVQEAFVRLAREQPAQLEGHLCQWLYTVVRHGALDILRKDRRMQLFTTERLDSRGVLDTSAERVVRQEAVGQALAVLATLSSQQQEAVRLKFEHGLSYREIAGVMGLTSNHVGVLLHTALRAIRRRMLEQEQASENQKV